MRLCVTVCVRACVFVRIRAETVASNIRTIILSCMAHDLLSTNDEIMLFLQMKKKLQRKAMSQWETK